MAVPRSCSTPRRRRSTWRAIPLALLLLAEGAAAAPPDNGQVFDRAWSLTARRYWDPALKGVDWDAARARHRPQAIAATDERALYAAINALLDTLHDSHAYATAPAERRRLAEEAADEVASGFGLDVVPVDGRWEVAGMVPGGPAARAGVAIGWTLATVDGRPPDGTRRFGEGDRAVLGFLDDAGRRHELALVGAALPPEPERLVRTLPGGALLLAFHGFERGVDRWIAGEIATARPAGVILDLRENDGGEAVALDRVAGLFFTRKRAVLRLIRRGETVESTIGAGPDAWTGPLAILVGPRSASAAEAFAALIEESGRGTTVGARTAGALTGGTNHRLPDGGLLSIAEYDVRTAGGRRLEGVGLVPRHAVTPTLDQRRRGDDPAAECARRLVLGGACTLDSPGRAP